MDASEEKILYSKYVLPRDAERMTALARKRVLEMIAEGENFKSKFEDNYDAMMLTLGHFLHDDPDKATQRLKGIKFEDRRMLFAVAVTGCSCHAAWLNYFKNQDGSFVNSYLEAEDIISKIHQVVPFVIGEGESVEETRAAVKNIAVFEEGWWRQPAGTGLSSLPDIPLLREEEGTQKLGLT